MLSQCRYVRWCEEQPLESAVAVAINVEIKLFVGIFFALSRPVSSAVAPTDRKPATQRAVAASVSLDRHRCSECDDESCRRSMTAVCSPSASPTRATAVASPSKAGPWRRFRPASPQCTSTSACHHSHDRRCAPRSRANCKRCSSSHISATLHTAQSSERATFSSHSS